MLTNCVAYEARLPWATRYLAVCPHLRVTDEALSSITSGLPPNRVIVRLRELPDPCAVAVAVTYVDEDYRAGYARLRNPSLQALAYLTLTRQVGQATEMTRAGDVVVAGAESPQALAEVLLLLGVREIQWVPLPPCDQGSLLRLSSYRLEVLR
ncbi:MAG: hypothetical protein ACP5HK_02105 [Acidilobus sp.]